ncbi:PAS domain S-box protein [Idiomarina sp.]|uniref:PAS domain S-box protein n=1 Tax=Idiomarina sp. TaxID=1874361 RepID=UPI0026102092|nr:PAS domain S-box protein [Idiomarina sp.]
MKLHEHELIGQHYELAVVEEDRERTKEHFEEAKRGSAQSYEIKVADKLGHIYYLDITNTPIIIDGEVTGVHGIARDRTEQRKNETQLKVLESGIEASVNGVAMYEAKKRGGNSWLWYESKLDERLSFHVALRTQIQEALQHEQFELFYQPIMTAAGMS